MPNVLHAYKVYRPEVEGGIPGAIAAIARAVGPPFTHSILVARDRGRSACDVVGGIPVRRSASLGTLWGLPFAPGYPVALARAAAKADLVALHAPFPLGDLGVVLDRRRTPLVLHWHAEITRQRALAPLYRPLVAATLARARAVIVSHRSIADTSPLLSAVREKVEVVPYGLDPAPWTELSEAECAEVAHIRNCHPQLLIAVGRLVTYKGFDVLLRAVRDLDAEVVLCGKGVEEGRLKTLVRDLGLGDRVAFEGFALPERLRVLLHAARGLVMPSVTVAEAFGLVQIEAMFCGCPVINTALPTAVPWVARNGEEALTVPPGDPAALSGAIARLLEDQELGRRLGTAGRERALTEFSETRFGERIVWVYEKALG